MRTVNLNLDDGLYLSDVQPDVSTGCAKLEGVIRTAATSAGSTSWQPRSSPCH